MDKLRIKIQTPSKAIERDSKAEKRLKGDGDYLSVGWRVLGVPFGGPIKGRDLDGEAFHEDTDIFLKTGDQVNMTYYHGFGPDDPEARQEKPVIIGRATYTGKDDRGHWFEPMFDMDEPLAQRVYKAGMDRVRASSGAVSHLVRMGKGGLIDVWPVGELALFDINEWRLPANDYAVIEAKAEDVTEAIPEAVSAAVEAVDESVEAQKINTTIIPEEELQIMTEEVKAEEAKKEVQEVQPTEQVDVIGEVKSLLAEMKKEQDEFKMSVVELLKAAPGIERGAPTVMKAANLGDPDPIEDFHNWIRTGKGKIKKHTSIVELADGYGGKQKAALQEGTTTEGGYLVPADYMNRIIEKRSEMDLLTRLGVQTFMTDKYQFYFPTEGTSMTKFTIVAEEGAVSAAENEPTFSSAGTPPVTLYKFMKQIKISAELDEDYNTGLDQSLANMIGRAWAATNNYYVQVGTGSSEPQGAFVGGTAGLTLDSASAIGVAEIPELIGKLKIPYRDRAVMVMNRTTGAYLSGLTGNQFQFRTPPASQTWANGEDLGIGYPVILTENAAAIGASAKSLLFGNFDFYGWVTNRSLQVKRLVELFAGNDQIGLQCKFRAGGAVLQAEAFQYATHPTA
jgi:HK97 family phage major capsid protein